MKVLRQWILE